MNLQPPLNGETEGEWHVVSTKWWHTPFSSVSWSYLPEKQLVFHRRIAQPPHYHATLISSAAKRRAQISSDAFTNLKRQDGAEEEEKLNPDLVGVRVAEGVLHRYESDVGFFYTPFPKIEPEDLGFRPALNLDVGEEELAGHQERWREIVEELVSNVPDMYMTESEGSLESSMTESARSSGSEFSFDFFNIPATPVSKASYANILAKGFSPGSSVSSIGEQPNSPTPVKSLNAFASSFVPSFSPPSDQEVLQFPSISDTIQTRHSKVKSHPPSLSDFTFPSLNAPLSANVKIKKDDQGFFTDIQVENPSNEDFLADLHQSSTLLPPFLQEPTRRRVRASRTREMVDRLRSQSQISPSNEKLVLDFNFDKPSKCVSHSPSPICHDLSFIQPRLSVSEDGGDRVSGLSTPSMEDEDDGWIDVAQPKAATSASKTKRARDLFLALTRRRTDSISSESMKELMTSEVANPPSQAPGPVSAADPPSPPATPPPVPTDGWIESAAVAPTQARAHGRKVSSSAHIKPNGNNRKKHKNSGSMAMSPTNTPFPIISHSFVPMLSSPQIVSPHAPVPFFFPAYPAIAMPVPYTAFMPVPYPVGVPGHMTAPPISSQYVSPSLLSPRAPLAKHYTTTTSNTPSRNRA